MIKTVAATILAATLAVSSLAPTRAHAADADEVARFLFGAAALAIIVNGLKDKKKPAVRPHPDTGRRAVPASCRRTVETNRGRRAVFGVPCLRREGVALARLPSRCLRTVDLPRRTIDAYGQRCLLNNNVEIARR